jgi:DNA (cytosine-5)-methyltransferase 1
MKYLSVCSGIEAATVAWHPLGWTPVAFAEIEKFPSAVLAHHYPHVPNLGDMTKFKDWPDADVDVLVGGTPCQSFSVAGLRKGMADPRGNLALTYLAIADRYRPEWVLWENVPGVLSSSGGRDFGAFLGGLAELGYGFAYRVLDAQYVRVDGFGRAVPQRRRRVFVVGHLGDWRRAAAVLFERESLSWDSPPRRQAGERVAPTISARPTGGGGLGTDFDCDGGLIASTGNVAHCLNAGAMGRIDYETETMIAHALRGEGFDASEDGSGRGTPLVPVIRGAICKDSFSGGAGGRPEGAAAGHFLPIAFDTYNQTITGDTTQTLCSRGDSPGGNAHLVPAIAIQERAISENADAGPDGVGVRDDGVAYTLEARTVPQAIAFDCKASGQSGFGVGEIASTLRSMGHADSHQNGGGHQAVAYDLRGREDGSQFEGPHETANIRAASGGSSRSYVAQSWAVRRLIPEECEALQAFQRGYTNIPWRGKPTSPDGPRYKALGNSMAVNVMRWLGHRINHVSNLIRQEAA